MRILLKEFIDDIKKDMVLFAAITGHIIAALFVLLYFAFIHIIHCIRG